MRAPSCSSSKIRLSNAPDLASIAHAMAVLEHSAMTSSPKILGGALVFTGPRVPVQTLLDYRNDGFTVDQFLEFFPSVARADVEAFLRILENRQE